jgi:hypothetical protein
MANDVVYRELVGGTKEILLTNRKPAGNAVIELPTIAAKDFFTIANNTTQGVVTFTHGTNAGNIATFAGNYAYIGNPSYSDSNGIQILTLPVSYVPSSAGNDEVVLSYT